MSLQLKDPDAVAVYRIDWTAYLGGRAIAASAWSVVPDAAEIVDQVTDGASCSASLGGGIAGGVYRLTNRVTLSDGIVDERTIVVRVEAR